VDDDVDDDDYLLFTIYYLLFTIYRQAFSNDSLCRERERITPAASITITEQEDNIDRSYIRMDF
jgi:hypothetical protein